MANIRKLDHAFDFVPIFVPLSQSSPLTMHERFVGSPPRPNDEPLLPPASCLRPNQLTRTKKCPRLTHQKRRLDESAIPPPSSSLTNASESAEPIYDVIAEPSHPLDDFQATKSRVRCPVMNELADDKGTIVRKSLTGAVDPQMLKRNFRCLILRSKFAVFLKSQFCEENLSFWLAAEEFRKNGSTKPIDAAELHEKAMHIYNKFFCPTSMELVNVECSTTKEIKRKIDGNAVEADMFEKAQAEVFHLLRYDCWPRFLKEGGLSPESEKPCHNDHHDTSTWDCCSNHGCSSDPHYECRSSGDFKKSSECHEKITRGLKNEKKSFVQRIIRRDSISDLPHKQKPAIGLRRSLSKLGILSGTKKSNSSSDSHKKRLSLLNFSHSPSESGHGRLDRTSSTASFRTLCRQHL